MKSVSIKDYDNSWYRPGGPWKRLLWYFINVLVMKNSWLPVSKLKVCVLRAFGAKIGTGVNIKPCVNIKYPWLLEVGDYTWIGEITLEDGSWVGAQSVVCPGVTLHTHAVLGVGSVAHHDLDAYGIYQGNPARKVRERVIG